MRSTFYKTAATYVRSPAQRLWRGYLGASGLSRGLGALGGLIVTLILSPGDRGIYAFFYSITITLVQFGPFSLDQAVSLAVAKGSNPERSRREGIQLSLLTGIPLLLVVATLTETLSPDQTTVLRLAAVASATLVLWWSGQVLAVVEGLGLIREKFLLHSILPAAFMVLLIGLIATDAVSANSLLIAFSGASVVALIGRQYSWDKMRSSPSIAGAGAAPTPTRSRLLRTGLALSPSQAGAILLLRADILMGGVLLLTTQLGQYAVASSFGLFASFYAQATSRAAYNSAAAGRRLPLARPLAIHTVFCLIVAIAGPVFTLTVYGNTYREAAGLTVVLSVAWWFQGVGTIFDGALKGLMLVGRSAAGNWIGVVVLAVLAIPFCARWGASGLAAASVASNLAFAAWVVSCLPGGARTKLPSI